MLNVIKNSLESRFDPTIVIEFLEAYQESKREFQLGGLRLNAVEGGRFCEAAFRLLEQETTGNFTALGKQLDIEKLMINLAQTPKGSHPDSVRLHIPRVLRVVYDIRNSRDTAHLGDGIDPNLQDATLVVSNLDWVMAEFVRLYHGCSANEAQLIIENLITKRIPAVQDFNGFLKVLKPKLKVSDLVLLVLYERGNTGASYEEIENWIKPSMRSNLRRTLHRLVNENAYLHFNGSIYLITRLGINEVESKKLHQ